MDKWILHIDGDGFFAYCEIARFPHLKGTPVVVGEERGIVCASTYEAKALGIPRGYPIFKVRKEFPKVTILSCHFELYSHYADKLATIVEPSVDVLERYSIDECFGLKSFPHGTSKESLIEWLQILKTNVQRATGLTYSFGLARTKVLAKIASKRDKPDGCTVIMPVDEADVLKDTSVLSLWGIGRRIGKQLTRQQVQTAYDFASWSKEQIETSFARPTKSLWYELHGRSMFPVTNDSTLQQSLQSTRSFTPTTDHKAFILAELFHNTDVAFTRMRNVELATNAVTIFLKTRDRKYRSATITHTHYTTSPIDIIHMLADEAARLYVPGTRYRATGITLWNLRPTSHVQEDLFGVQHTTDEKNVLMHTIDAIRHRYGQGSIALCVTLPSVVDRAAKRAVRKATEYYIYGLPLPYLGEVY